MRRRVATTLAVVLLAALAIACTARPTAEQTPLTSQQQKVLDYLRADWGVDTSVTGIDLAMEIVGGDYTDDDRYALGIYVREHPEVHRVIRMFGWETVALTPEEKRIARVLARAESEQQQPPSLAELARTLALRAEAIRDGLRVLERFGIIRRNPGVDGIGYQLAKARYVNWEGGMRITFMAHRVQVHGVKQLDTY
ncbi:MAG: hypothetical protein ACE5MH_08000 [Terriglobia bacterium]